MTGFLDELLRPEVQQYIIAHGDADEKDLVLRQQSVYGLSPALIAQQIAGRRKAKEKLPFLFNTPGTIYPPSINLEQCSSEITARFKKALLEQELNGRPETGADLTGGFGVDTYFLHQLCERFYYVEPDAQLLSIVKKNHTNTGTNAIEHVESIAEKFIDNTKEHFSFLFIDPSRRKDDKKVFLLSDCKPNVPALLPTLLEKADLLLIKVSPLLDLVQGTRELVNVKKIVVLAVRNECREVLFLCGKHAHAEPEIECVNITSAGEHQQFLFTVAEERNATSSFSDPLEYIYEPNAAILKGGAFKLVGHAFGLKKIEQHTHLYTSENLIENFPGRTFKLDLINPSEKLIRDSFSNGQVNVVTRNYPLTPASLKKRYGLQDGGEKFLLGFSGAKAKFLVVARRIS